MKDNIKENELKYNLVFYKILKFLIQSKLKDEQINQICDYLNVTKFDIKLFNGLINSFEELEELKNIYTEILDYSFLLQSLRLSLYLIFLKNIFLDISKKYGVNERAKLDSINDKLSIKYDMQCLNLPYSRRVLDAINTDLFFNNVLEKNQYFNGCDDLINLINQQTKNIINEYKVRVGNLFLIILSESTNQSIRSLAGADYEKRCLDVIKNHLEVLENNPTHDKEKNIVEYDIIAKTSSGKRIGFNIKRTLRERYKQNMENIEFLGVDAIVIITLGTDLREQIIQNILGYKNTFIVVASECYEIYKHYDKVISSNNIDNINSILEKYLL